MFKFNFTKQSENQACSTGVFRNVYEHELVRILSLPLKMNSKQLEMPNFIQQQAFTYQMIGEECGISSHSAKNTPCSLP